MAEQTISYLSPQEAAKRLGVTIRTLHRWEEMGKIKSSRTPGGHRRYRAEEIDDLLAAS